MTDSNTNTPKIQNILDFKTIDLPIVSILEPFKKSVNSYRNIVLNAEPGAGKTSIIPLALLPLIDKDKKILLLQPRRIAAKSTAARLAAILEQPLGECIGYRIRNESKVSRKTRIEVITEGILLRMLQADPELIDVGAIIFDEFHERNLESDLGLAFAIEVQQSIRDDLKLVIMSATLNSNALVEMLDDVSELSCEGRCFPVAVEYLPPARNSNWLGVLIEAVNKSVNFKQLNELGELENQDVLVFLPGAGEINLAKKKLDEFYSERDDLLVFPLYGSLDFKQQQRVFKRQVGYIKIVLATNIAETSLTIDGIATVIDSGLMKQSQFDPNCGFNRLETKKISKASAIQRAGRAGRLGPGKCIRLWSESDPIREQSVPDILREDLASFALDLSRWGITDPNELCLLDQPNEGALNQARSLLSGMDAIDHKLRLTEKGKLIASLGVHPRIGRMLVASIDYATVEMACLLAAMLEAKDVFQGDKRFDPDFLSRVFFVLETSRPDYQVSQIKQQANQLFQKSKKDLDFHPRKQHTLERSIPYVSQLLAHAFPDRIAIKRRNSYKLSNGTGAVLQQSFCKDSDLLVVVHLGGQSNYGGQTRNSRQP
ncbi:MAG: ATP-dependent helicase HrpB, partial [Kangiellaceae bacterium]|nr:ATP-dependent helicase HrpB [Kangiellaceae bacterium]